MIHNGKECDFETVRGDTQADLDRAIRGVARGRPVVEQKVRQVTGKDGKRRLLAQIYIEREAAACIARGE